MIINLDLAEVKISRKRQDATPGEENNISASELEEINNASLSYVRSLPIKEIEKRVETVSVTSLESATDLQQAKEVLSKYGIVIVKNFLSADQVSSAQDYIRRGFEGVSFDGDFEDERVRVQVQGKELNTYKKRRVTRSLLLRCAKAPIAAWWMFSTWIIFSTRAGKIFASHSSVRQWSILSAGMASE